MNKSHSALLQLLKISLGNSNCFGLNSKDIDWREVFTESRCQGVAGVAFDAFNRMPESENIDSKLIFEWMCHALKIETVFHSYVEALCRLSAIVERLGMRMMVLKGYGCSRNYPEPNHRPCGDIDIFLLDNSGRHKEDLLRRLEENLKHEYGITVDYENGHHSQFMFCGFCVEDHYTVLDVGVHKSNFYIEELLEKLAAEEITEIDVNGIPVYLPSPRFNSIHLLRHMASDFATVKASLRQVLDWSTFIKSNDIDWKFVFNIAHKSNMNRFLDVLNGICVYYLGYPDYMFPIEYRDEPLEKKVIEEILNSKETVNSPNPNFSLSQKFHYVWNKTIRMCRNSWKYDMVYDESMFEAFCWKARNRMRRI